MKKVDGQAVRLVDAADERLVEVLPERRASGVSPRTPIGR
jgi:hypothetical protein